MLSDEKEPLLKNRGSAPAKYIETQSEYHWRWFSIIITYIGTFTTFLQSSLYWTSLWPYLTQVDPTTPESFFGIIISAYSLGSVISAPLLGWWSNRIKSTRWPVVAGFIINIGGNLLMAFVEAFPVTNRRWIMLAARFISGFGSGGLAVVRSFYAYASTSALELNLVISIHYAIISAAILGGAGLAAAFSPIGYPAFTAGPLHIDMYTSSAWVSTILSLICAILYLSLYNEYNISIADEHEDGDENASGMPPRPIDHLAAFNCILVRFVMLFCVVYDDTIGSPFTMSMFDWNRSEAVLYNGIIQAVSGIIDFIGNILVGVYLLGYVKERTTVLFGLPSFMLFYLISFSWPGLPKQNHLGANFFPNGTYREDSSESGIEALTNAWTASLSSTADPSLSADTALGCNYEWCEYTTRISVPQYIIAYVFLTLAFSTAFTPTSTLFTKVLGPRRQGTWQGIFTAAGSLAMTISPVLVSTIFEYSGPRVAWAIALACLLITMIINLASWKRLVPFVIIEASDDHEPSKVSSSIHPLDTESDVGIYTSYDSIGDAPRRPKRMSQVRQLSRYDNSLTTELET